MGEIFVGDTQERASAMSRIISAKSKDDITVLCVHATKPIVGMTTFKSGGLSPGAKDAVYTRSLHTDGHVNQMESWEADRRYASSMSASARKSISSISIEEVPREMFAAAADISQKVKKDDLTTVQKEYGDLFKEVVSAVPYHENQVGLCIMDEKGVSLLDCFNLSKSWKDIKDSFIKKEVGAISKFDSDSVFEFVPSRAIGKIRELLGNEITDEKVQHTGPDSDTVTFSLGENHIGEAVVFNGVVIHLLITR
jgi:hypothetical protein